MLFLLTKAISSAAGKAKLSLSKRLGWSTAVLAPDRAVEKRIGVEQKIEVEQTTLDEVVNTSLEEHLRERIRLLKIDTEGLDFLVLEGAKEVLSQGRAAFLVEVNAPYLCMMQKGLRDLTMHFFDNGYNIFWIIPHNKSLLSLIQHVRLEPVKDIKRFEGKSGDLLAVPSSCRVP